MGSTIPHSHQSNRSGNEGHCGLQRVDVRGSTWGAPSRIKRLTRNHVRFIRLKNFSDRLLETTEFVTNFIKQISIGAANFMPL